MPSHVCRNGWIFLSGLIDLMSKIGKPWEKGKFQVYLVPFRV